MLALFGDGREKLRRLTKELLATESRKVTAGQLKRWKDLMNSTDGELLEEVLALKQCLTNPKVAEKLIRAIPDWVADLHKKYLEKLAPPVKKAISRINYPPEKVGKLRPKSN